ncbi:hypothetical protein EV356DRAFT_510170 [Viridothelium virens]|uniref:Thymidylate kinase n=1 Tax=Viridothelium virens TaxID=1048519 RepID=A0A6A6GW35_VIRVR|nr:hypothetical protein EV356DRAFT_510170 [Viridothelium virens]
MATAIRQPFGELGTPRLQQLQNVKNRQNAITTSHSAPAKSTFTFSSPLKRQHSPPSSPKGGHSVFDDADTENMDPSIFLSPSKRAKNDNGLPTKKPYPSFSLNVTPTLSTSPRPISTPKSRPLRGSTPPPTSRMTAPAGRSPQRQRVGLLSKNRRLSAPIKRIDPPSSTFSTPSTRTSKSTPGLPFSIDAALSGSLSTYKPSQHDAFSSHPVAESASKPMPRSWFFAIHEDTPEQEATNLMEHSACVLDISSDEEDGAGPKSELDVKGKENVPPPDWVAAQPRVGSVAAAVAASAVVAEEDGAIKLGRSARQVALAAALKGKVEGEDAMAVDAPPRSPLSDLAPEEFYAEGMDRDSVAVEGDGEGEESVSKADEGIEDAVVKEEMGPTAVGLEHAVECENDFLIYESDSAKEA